MGPSQFSQTEKSLGVWKIFCNEKNFREKMKIEKVIRKHSIVNFLIKPNYNAY